MLLVLASCKLRLHSFAFDCASHPLTLTFFLFPIGALCADKLASAEAEYSPFAECGDISYEEYVKRVKSSAQWGGQLELRALSSALNRPIVVYSADTAPLTMDDDSGNHRDDKIREPILLSFHRHYFALGEHYNFLVRKDPRK